MFTSSSSFYLYMVEAKEHGPLLSHLVYSNAAVSEEACIFCCIFCMLQVCQKDELHLLCLLCDTAFLNSIQHLSYSLCEMEK
jgi:hypothetical protein